MRFLLIQKSSSETSPPVYLGYAPEHIRLPNVLADFMSMKGRVENIGSKRFATNSIDFLFQFSMTRKCCACKNSSNVMRNLLETGIVVDEA